MSSAEGLLDPHTWDGAPRGEPVGRTRVERAPLTLGPDHPVVLRVFVDRSVVEGYASDRQVIGRHVDPTRSDSAGGTLVSKGRTAHLYSVTAWRTTPSNPF